MAIPTPQEQLEELKSQLASASPDLKPKLEEKLQKAKRALKVKDKVYKHIQEQGFTPFNYANLEDFAENPARIQPLENFSPEDWLTVNEAEFKARISDRTFYRWQRDHFFINFTQTAEAGGRHYVKASDFEDFIAKKGQKEQYIYPPDLAKALERLADYLSPDKKPLTLSNPMAIDVELRSKMLSLPQEISTRFEEAFTKGVNQTLEKQREEFSQYLSKLEPILTKQLEYKEKDDQSREDLKKTLARSHRKILITTATTVVFVAVISLGLFIWQNGQNRHAKLEREEAEKKLAGEYAQKLDSLQTSFKQDFKNLGSSLSLVKERLNIKEEGPKDSPESEPTKEKR